MPTRKYKRRRTVGLAAITAGAIAALALVGCVRTSGGAWYIKSAPLPRGWPELTPVGEVHIREYPEYRAASINREQADGTGRMFNVLFQHIKRNDIAMTAPVDMGYQAGEESTAEMASMAFLYRTQDLGTTGTDGQVRIQDVPRATYASTGVRGQYTQERFDKGLARLTAWLESQDVWHATGTPRYLGYNGPFTLPFLRYGEVQLPVAHSPKPSSPDDTP